MKDWKNISAKWAIRLDDVRPVYSVHPTTGKPYFYLAISGQVSDGFWSDNPLYTIDFDDFGNLMDAVACYDFPEAVPKYVRHKFNVECRKAVREWILTKMQGFLLDDLRGKANMLAIKRGICYSVKAADTDIFYLMDDDRVVDWGSYKRIRNLIVYYMNHYELKQEA